MKQKLSYILSLELTFGIQCSDSGGTRDCLSTQRCLASHDYETSQEDGFDSAGGTGWLQMALDSSLNKIKVF